MVTPVALLDVGAALSSISAGILSTITMSPIAPVNQLYTVSVYGIYLGYRLFPGQSFVSPRLYVGSS